MRTFLRKLRAARFLYEPLIEVSVSRGRILRNLHAFQEAVPSVGGGGSADTAPSIAVAPVLKSNAYGHGLVPVARILDGERLPFLCVDSYAEALVLRNERIRTPLLVIGYTPPGNALSGRPGNTSFGITSIDELRALAASARRKLKIHLKIDTGMHRQGVMPNEVNDSLTVIEKSRRLVLEGVYSHLADADTPDSADTARQIELWNDVVRHVKATVPGVRYFHLSATAGSAHAAKIDANVMRLGIGLYGFDPAPAGAREGAGTGSLGLLPALSMKTRLTSLRTIAAGEKIGYHGTFTAPREMIVATVPAGYAEGVDRRLSNAGVFTVRGRACPIVGRVSMNITSIDVSDVPEPRIGDEVVVVSDDPSAPNSIAWMAKTCGTIPYELLVHIPASLRRTVTE